MGCVESRRKRSKRINKEIKRAAERRKKALNVLVIGTESAEKEKLIEKFRDVSRFFDESPKCDPDTNCVTDTKTRCMIEEFYFAYRDRDYRVLDLAREVSITKTKWIHCLEDVNIIIFVLDISQYETMKEESPEKSHISESMNLFEELCNNIWFKRKSIIMSLNLESFENKLKKTPFSTHFPDYKGSDTFNDIVENNIMSTFRDLDHCKDSDKTDKQIIFEENNWLSILDDVNDMCPVKEETENYRAHQAGICDESLCSLCVFALWYILHCCCTLQCCCRRPRRYRQ